MDKNRIFKEKGITLIALIVTIVILLILAGTSISVLTGENGILTRAKQAKEQSDKAAYDEERALERLSDEINSYQTSADSYNQDKGVNAPKVTKGMIPIKWNGTNWVVCSATDPTWYNYKAEKVTENGVEVEAKYWANIMLSDGTYKAGIVTEGTVVAENELGSMYVWIPRYAYQMPEDAQTKKGTIDVTFLMGNTNKDKNGTEYIKATSTTNTETTKVVHPGFTLGNKELTGIWVAKFEASGTNSEGKAVGNRSETSSTAVAVEPSVTIAKSLPNKVSWREISIGNMQYYCMSIAGEKKDQYGLDYCNSHLIKNSEWGAVAYLCYSNYGEVPQINANGNNKSGIGYYDLITGRGPDKTSTYSEGAKVASTTGNVTGIYDMNGGAWEYVAAYYDNGGSNINTYGKSTTSVAGKEVKYIESGKVKSEYASLWDVYDVSTEVTIYPGTENEETITRATWQDGNNYELKHALARYLVTKEMFNNLPKGIGVSEISNTFSFYNIYNTNSWAFYKLKAGTTETAPDFVSGDTSSVWDSDRVNLGGAYAYFPFVERGGYYHSGSYAGVFYSSIYTGNGYSNYGFRSALVL